MAKTDGSGHPARQIAGVVRGVVIENEDPTGMGRVKITVPMLTGVVHANWAAVAVAAAGIRGSKAAVPEVGEEVVIAFEDGDMDYPVVIGVLREFL